MLQGSTVAGLHRCMVAWFHGNMMPLCGGMGAKTGLERTPPLRPYPPVRRAPRYLMMTPDFALLFIFRFSLLNFGARYGNHTRCPPFESRDMR